jgi:transposase-like protein
MEHWVGQLESLLRRRPALACIVRLVVLGHSRKQIAATLKKSIHTVNWHLAALYREVPGLTAPRLVRIVTQSGPLQALLEELATGAATPPRRK